MRDTQVQWVPTEGETVKPATIIIMIWKVGLATLTASPTISGTRIHRGGRRCITTVHAWVPPE